MYRASYPFAPLILGLILGPLADQNFAPHDLDLSTASITRCCMRPVGLVLLVAVGWSFYYGIRRSLEESAEKKAQARESQKARAGSEQSA